MSQNNNGNNNNNGNPPSVPFSTKAGYIGTGVLIGLVIYPFVRKAIAKVQPKMDQVLDDLTGKAEGFAEKASDLIARAKERLATVESEEEAHGHSDEHDHEPKKPKNKPH